ncbi:hypothetical protein [Sphingobacterium corticis]
MKIGNRIIQNRMIEVNTPDHFEAKYKGLHIYVSSDHGYGKSADPCLTRYWMEIWNWENGICDCQTWEDCRDIKEAIYKAIEGACLL